MKEELYKPTSWHMTWHGWRDQSERMWGWQGNVLAQWNPCIYTGANEVKHNYPIFDGMTMEPFDRGMEQCYLLFWLEHGEVPRWMLIGHEGCLHDNQDRNESPIAKHAVNCCLRGRMSHPNMDWTNPIKSKSYNQQWNQTIQYYQLILLHIRGYIPDSNLAKCSNIWPLSFASWSNEVQFTLITMGDMEN